MNPVRGDVPLVIDGRERRLRLTFAALAEIEGGREMLSVLKALLQGGGEREAAESLALDQVDIAEAAGAVARVFREAAG